MNGSRIGNLEPGGPLPTIQLFPTFNLSFLRPILSTTERIKLTKINDRMAVSVCKEFHLGRPAPLDAQHGTQSTRTYVCPSEASSALVCPEIAGSAITARQVDETQFLRNVRDIEFFPFTLILSSMGFGFCDGIGIRCVRTPFQICIIAISTFTG